jgi:c-di-GMP-binding flagellar brake protein YcgR
LRKRKIIEAGSLIEIKSIDEDDAPKYRTRVENADTQGEVGVVVPISEGSPLMVHSGDRFELTYSTDASLYIQQAEVIRRYMSGPIACVLFSLIGKAKRINRRQYFRMPVLIEGKTRVEDEDDHPMTTINLSAGGVRFITVEQYKKGTKILVQFKLDDQMIELEAEVISTGLMRDSIRRYDTRAKFTNVTSTVERIILQFLFEQQRNIKRKGLA